MEKLFTPEQQKELASNPYTRTVNDRQIRFTVEFKRYLLSELSSPKMRHFQIFRNAGYDPDVLGRNRIAEFVERLHPKKEFMKQQQPTSFLKKISQRNAPQPLSEICRRKSSS